MNTTKLIYVFPLVSLDMPGPSVLIVSWLRWFPASAVEVPQAAFLDVILYSRAQLVKEYADMPVKGAGDELPQVSVKNKRINNYIT